MRLSKVRITRYAVQAVLLVFFIFLIVGGSEPEKFYPDENQTLGIDDILEWEKLCRILNDSREKDEATPATLIFSVLSEETQEDISKLEDGIPPGLPLKEKIIRELNQEIENESLFDRSYDEKFNGWKKVELNEDTKVLLAKLRSIQVFTAEDENFNEEREALRKYLLIRSNRLLLEAGFEGVFKKHPKVMPYVQLEEAFLAADPSISVVTNIANRSYHSGLFFLGLVLLVSLFLRRVFCSHVCPLGTILDIFDITVGVFWRFVTKPIRKKMGNGQSGALRFLKYGILAGLIFAASGGVVLSQYISPLSLLTNCIGNLHMLFNGIALIPEAIATLGILVSILLLGLIRKRFFCRVLCPSGAFFALWNLLCLRERVVSEKCVDCGKCVAKCSFDALNNGAVTTGAECAACYDCHGICPVDCIEFSWKKRFFKSPQKDETDVSRVVSRRSFVFNSCFFVVGGAGVLTGMKFVMPENRGGLIRPPGAMPGKDFLERCVRCGKCIQVCPSGFLQAGTIDTGIENLWTPIGKPLVAGCDPDCNRCNQVCPTEAIQVLDLEQKNKAKMGTAVVDKETCTQCGECETVCTAAGHDAVFLEPAIPGVPGGGMLPVVDEKKCVGCGLCENICYRVNVQQDKAIKVSAIIVKVLE